jgi:uncharacterized membrane protein
MKKIKYLSFVVIFFVALIIPAQAFAQSPQDFKFESFHADYYLDRDAQNAATLKVDETLIAIFPGLDQNHGILRAIPERYKDHTLSLKNISVKDQYDKPYNFTASDQNDNKVLKIGDANKYVHGQVIYKISYQLQDPISFYNDHDELFWDINGDQWQQPFATVTATVHMPKQLSDSLQDRQKCYVGAFGATGGNCSITKVINNDRVVINTSADAVSPRQTLSMVLGFNPGTFKLSPAVKKEKQKQKIEFISAGTLVLIPPLAAGIFMFRRWRKFGDDPKGRGVIIPEYGPPEGLDTLTSDFLMKQVLRNSAFGATIIDMAIKGYITIIEIPKKGIFGKKDYELRLDKVPGQTLSKHVHSALKIIFDELEVGKNVKISEFKKSTTKQRATYKSMKALEDSLDTDMAILGYFKMDPQKVKLGYRVWSAILFFLSWGLVSLAGALNFIPLNGLAGGSIAACVVVFLYSFIMPARTEKGVRANDDLLGLKDYIKLAEADRLKFLQSPEGAEKVAVADEFDPKMAKAKIKLFEELLPYAMLFGLEKDWAKQFNDIYINPPGWYQGGNWTAFNAGYLAGSLSDFNGATAASFAAPSSSSGSGFSGGGAGGGGGGGGGGGW